MRFLILSCNTGEGHNSCAKALKEVIDRNGDQCVIEDALAFISKFTSIVLSKGHVFLYRYFPYLFSFGYSYAERHKNVYKKDTFLHRYMCSGKKRLAPYIDDGGYDVVICTHVFSALILSQTIPLCKNSFVSAFVATDYTCSPITEASDLDVYFIPDESLKEEYVQRGVKAETLVASGIPVRQMFYMDSSSPCDDGGASHLLVMSGSMGCGPVEGYVREVAKYLENGEKMTVVCGSNKGLRKRLSKRYCEREDIKIEGYVNDVAALMERADLYFTKPGGISVSEAKVKCLPMVFIDSVAGCEEYNCRFFVSRGGAVTGDNVSVIAQKSIELLRDDSELVRMKEKLNMIDQKNSSEYIYSFLVNKKASGDHVDIYNA